MANKKLRILVIDDEVTQRMLVKDYLEDAGHVVRQADDGRRGLKMATSTGPDIILLDVMLPSIDGFELCRSLKQHPITANTPVILITASREGDVIARGLAAGADDFVTKPVDWEFLADRVSHVARKSVERSHLLHMVESRSAADDANGHANDGPQPRDEPGALALDELMRGADLQASHAVAQAAADIEALKSEYEQEFARLRAENERLVVMARNAVQMTQAAAEKSYAAEVAKLRAGLDVEASSLRNRMEAETSNLRTLMEAERRTATEREDADRAALAKRNAELKALREAFDAERRRFENEITSLRDRLAALPSPAAIEAPWSIVLRAMTWQASLASALTTRTKAALAAGRMEPARLADIDRTAETLATAIGNAKRFAHAMATAGECKPGSIRVAKLITEIANQAKPIAAKARVDLRTHVASDVPAVIADEQRLRYAWICLIVNAIRYTPPGGRVTLEAVADRDGGIRLQVADTGVGMTAAKVEELNRTFDTPAAPLRAGEPAGLGVPIAAALARQLGGSVVFESKQGGGTRAGVVFPRTRCGVNIPETLAGFRLPMTASGAPELALPAE